MPVRLEVDVIYEKLCKKKLMSRCRECGGWNSLSSHVSDLKKAPHWIVEAFDTRSDPGSRIYFYIVGFRE